MTTARQPKLNDVTVQLSGEDGNVFNLMGIVTKGMKRAGHGDLVEEFLKEVYATESYDEALQTMMKWVNVQ